MLPDNRLDFIGCIEERYLETIAKLRHELMRIDEALRGLGASEDAAREGAMRCILLARNNLELTCQYTVKALCIMGEMKDSEDYTRCKHPVVNDVLSKKEMGYQYEVHCKKCGKII